MEQYRHGLTGGVAIALGYLSVSFTIGLMAVSQGFTALAAVLLSFTNVTSAGQVAGLFIIAGGGGMMELAMSQLVINLRYALMSLSLSQRLAPGTTLAQRALIAFAITDEIFAVASAGDEPVTWRYYAGLMTLPIAGWVLGTFLGAVAGTLLPAWLTQVMTMALYAMFIAIVVPPARHSRPVLAVVILSTAISCLFTYLPALKAVSSGFIVMIAAIAASALAAWLFPLKIAKEGA